MGDFESLEEFIKQAAISDSEELAALYRQYQHWPDESLTRAKDVENESS